MSLNFVLVPGPLVRALSWEPTAEELRKSGHNVQIPDVLDDLPSPPAWREWTSHLLQRIKSCHEPILVGHSSASALVADLAHRLPCRGVVIVDGEVPPSRGPATPVRLALFDFIRGLAADDGTLPSGHDGSPATPNARPSLAWTCWRETRSPSRNSSADYQNYRSIGSTIRSNSPAGITFQPGSFNARRSTITPCWKRNGGDGRS
ncbi:alpha/beta fold hydrolase [Bradyrhizobium lablabi]|uniref:alpha/beta fold hydrolase n=1 Tax=Bradyrhizobium lablabi TaxID=722472 RepID=UPI0018F8CA41